MALDPDASIRLIRRLAADQSQRRPSCRGPQAPSGGSGPLQGPTASSRVVGGGGSFPEG
jgi:hypothetical protein